jgi:hypothetical protein
MTDLPESLKLLVLGGGAAILSLRPRGTFPPRPDRFPFGSGGPLPARLVLVDRPHESVRVA